MLDVWHGITFAAWILCTVRILRSNGCIDSVEHMVLISINFYIFPLSFSFHEEYNYIKYQYHGRVWIHFLTPWSSPKIERLHNLSYFQLSSWCLKMYPASSWFLLCQTKEKPLQATIFSFKLTPRPAPWTNKLTLNW